MTRHAEFSAFVSAGRRALAVVSLLAAGCTDKTIPDLNNPELLQTIPNQAQLQAQATGLLAGDREQHAFFILVLETMGRDAYRIDGADPRYIQQPLGQFSPGAFLVDFTWNSTYRTIRAAQLLASGVEGSSAFSAEEKAASAGFARTIQALEYIHLIDTRDTLGVPITTGSGAIESVACLPKVLAYTSALLDSAQTNLQSGGTHFPFRVPPGFSDSPAGFLKFNRGLAAKVHVYRGFAGYRTNKAVNSTELNAALTALDASFQSTNPAEFRGGIYHSYSTASGDLGNGNFDKSVIRANPKVLSEAEPGDLRLAKVHKDPSFTKALPDSSAVSDIVFENITGPTTPLPILINEELILVRAEALWGLNQDAAALTLVNLVRTNSGGLPPRLLASFPTRLDILREILKQKRYSLLFESGSRLVDYRMFGLYSELGMELRPPVPGPQVIPFPSAETNARAGDIACK
jgi:starch-binding outer membrane protein, SusD/RagB family